jgi:NAD(P)-dependent dehydrogenase (short-subunit alcohol dehydrogenase family)
MPRSVRPAGRALAIGLQDSRMENPMQKPGTSEHVHTEQQPHPPLPPQKLEKPGLESQLEPRPKYQAPAYKPAGKLDGKRALITGGDSGIGRAVAVLFAREGADVAINYLAEEQRDADETRRAVEAEGRTCILIPGDLTLGRFCRELVERAIEGLGGLDILVSNAAHQNRKQIDELTPEEFDRTFKTNVYAYYYLTSAAVPHLAPGSAIIATSSATGFRGSEELPDYSATKGAINQYTKVLAKQLVDKGIRVNAIAPGPVWTPLNAADEGMAPEDVSRFGQQTPLQRPAQPEEVAPAYVFLASEADSSYITGIILPVMGGETIGG